MRIRLRTPMILMVVLAIGLAAKIRWDHCHERVRFYKVQSERFEEFAKFDSVQISIWRNSMGPEVSHPVRIDMRELKQREASRDVNREHARLYAAISV